MIRLIADVFKALHKVVYGLSGQFLAKNRRGDTDKFQFALDLVKGRAVLLHPTVPQGVAITGVPETAIKNALTQQGLRKSRTPRAVPAAPPPAGWEDRLAFIMREVSSSAVLEKLAAHEAALSPNGAVEPDAGTAAANGGNTAAHP